MFSCLIFPKVFGYLNGIQKIHNVNDLKNLDMNTHKGLRV
jgi:hypothetical protein